MRTVALALVASVSVAHADPDLRPWKVVPHLVLHEPAPPPVPRVEAPASEDGVPPLVREYQARLVKLAVRTLGTVARVATDGVAGWKVQIAGTLGVATAF